MPRPFAEKPQRSGTPARRSVKADPNELVRSRAASKLPAANSFASRAIGDRHHFVGRGGGLLLEYWRHRRNRGDRNVRIRQSSANGRQPWKRHDRIAEPIRRPNQETVRSHVRSSTSSPLSAVSAEADGNIPLTCSPAGTSRQRRCIHSQSSG